LALLNAVDAEFARLGVDDQVIGVLPGNVDALRLYQRRGFRPTWLYLPRFGRADRIS
jgi:ribosomal protein S18 acetylase RimI-like enzyme